MLGFPAVTLRDRIERPEALDAGSMITAGVQTAPVLEAVAFARRVAETTDRTGGPADYAITDTARRVVAFILGTAHTHHATSGIRRRP